MAAQRDLKESSIMALTETWLSERDRGAHLFSHSVGAVFRMKAEHVCAATKNIAAQGMSEREKLNFHPRCFCILTYLISPPQQD